MLDMILYFFIYAIGGWFLETGYFFLLTGKYQKRATLLHSPMCVVYGAGAAAMVLTLSWAREDTLALFCGGFFVCSSVEYLISLVSERLYGVLWWDYSSMRIHLNGRVCAFYSLCWGVIAVVFFKYIHPFVALGVSYMGIQLKGIVCMLLTIYFLRDLRLTGRELKKFSRGEQSMCDRAFPFLKAV